MSVRPMFDKYEQPSGASALLDAVNLGKFHLTRFILDAVENRGIVNTRDFKGKTPLIRACYIKEERTRGRIVHLLLLKHANVNLRDDSGRTALSYACELRCNDIVQIMVRNNVFPDIPDNRGTTPLMYAASVGNDRAIEILLKSFRRLGLDVDKVNSRGETALIMCAKEGYLACASILAIDGRANLQKTDSDGLTAEEIARQQGCSTPEVTSFSQTRRRHRRHDLHYDYVSRSRTNVNRRRQKPVGVKKTEKVESFSPPISAEQSRYPTKTYDCHLPRVNEPRTTELSYSKRTTATRKDCAGSGSNHGVYLGVTPDMKRVGDRAGTITDRLETLSLNTDHDLASASC